MASKWLTEVTDQDAYQDRVGDRVGSVLDWIGELQQNDEYLTDQQAQFIQETRDRLEEFGETARLTPRQYQWIKGLYERLEERLRRPRGRRSSRYR